MTTISERAADETRAAATRRPKLLDLYCCQGGAAAGYAAAGFEVVGIDIAPQPRYPFEFFQRDALSVSPAGFDAIHASPPCQAYSKAQRIQGRGHPDMIAATRALCEESGLPYVIENVEGARAHLREPVTLCGTMFALRTYRHRLFETGGGFELAHRMHPRHTAPVAKMGRPAQPGEYLHVVGNFSGAQDARALMAMPWASRDGLREAIPPAYTQWIGTQLIAHIATAPDPEAAP